MKWSECWNPSRAKLIFSPSYRRVPAVSVYKPITGGAHFLSLIPTCTSSLCKPITGEAHFLSLSLIPTCTAVSVNPSPVNSFSLSRIPTCTCSVCNKLWNNYLLGVQSWVVKSQYIRKATKHAFNSQTHTDH